MLRILTGIARHPLNRHRPLKAIGRFIGWQIGTRLLGAPVAVPFVGNTRLLVRRGMTGASGNVYCGLHEFEDMAFVAHALRPDDRFVDVGANVGSYTVLAAGVCGARCVSLEPIPQTFSGLIDNVLLNDLRSRVDCRNIAVGSAAGTLRFTAGLETINHALADGEAVADTVSVPVARLDDILGDLGATIVKIDVEGFETPVIRGAQEALRSPSLLAVLMELNGSGDRYGFSDDALRAQMTSLGFAAARYEPATRTLRPHDGDSETSGNTLYVRRWDDVQARLKTAPQISVHGAML